MTADVERPVICSKCGARSGDDWSQCRGVCPLPDSPHYKATAERTKTCYQCDRPVTWLAPDSRCCDCTRLTPEEL